MKEDIRYLERLVTYQAEYSKKEIVHPADKELASFIEGKLTGNRKDKILEHLLHCHLCADIVANTHLPVQVPKQNSKYYGYSMMLVAASVLMAIIVSAPTQRVLGIITIDQLQKMGYKSPPRGQNTLSLSPIDIDSELDKIRETTDMRDVRFYTEAEILYKNRKYSQAIKAYKSALISIRHNPDEKKRIKQRIVLYYRLLMIVSQKQIADTKGMYEYKEILRYSIGMYTLEYQRELE